MLYLSFKFVRKFKFCVSPLVKRYPGIYPITFNLLLLVFIVDMSTWLTSFHYFVCLQL